MEQVIVTTSGSVITQGEQLKQISYMREAIRQGHKFIKLRLTENFEQNRDQSEIKFNGVKSIAVYPAGMGKGRIPKYDVVVRGGALVFYFKTFEDPHKDGWYADLLDDKLPAKYSETGYNRDFLASHIESGWFKVIDPKVRHDINARQKKIAEIVAQKKEEKSKNKAQRLKELKERQEMLQEEIRAAETENGVTSADDKTGGGVD